MPINPDFDNVQVDPQEVMPGPVLGLRVLMEVALGSPDDSYRYIKEFRKMSGAAQQGDATD